MICRSEEQIKEYVHQKKDHCCSYLGTAFARERLLSELGHVKTVASKGGVKTVMYP